MLQIKKCEKKQAFSINFKDISFISQDLKIIEKDKRSRAKLN